MLLTYPHSNIFACETDMKKTAPRSSLLAATLAGSLATFCLFLATPAMSASFDCGKKGSSNEQLICDDPQLSAMDDQLAKTFKVLRRKMADPHAFTVASDQQWIWREKNCHSRECLVDWYQKRQTELLDGLRAVLSAAESTEQMHATAANNATLAPSAQAAMAAMAAPKPATVTKPTTPTTTPALQLALSSTQIAGIAPDGAALRPHYLSGDKGEYLYADPDGVVTNGIPQTVSVHYLGIEHGQYILEARRKDTYVRYTCSGDCALINQLQLPGDVETDTVIIKNDHLSLPSQMVTDAINGLLAESGVN